MKEAEHRKQMLIQQIADHRERMRLELVVLHEANPVKPVIEGGRRLFGILGALRPGRGGSNGGGGGGGGSIESRLAQLDPELLRTALPVVLQVMRAVLERRRERLARKKGT